MPLTLISRQVVQGLIMNKQFWVDEFMLLWRVILRYHVALLTVSLATALLIAIHPWGYIIYDFPIKGMNQAMYYGVLPFVFGLVVLRKTPAQLGMGLGNYKFWIPTASLFIVIIVPLIAITSNVQGMKQSYGISNFVFKDYFFSMLLWMFGWEYIFRGFLLAGLRDSFKEGAIIVQMIPFTLLHAGQPDVVIYGCILSGLAFGYISYRGESFLPSYIVHIVINTTVTLFAVGYFD